MSRKAHGANVMTKKKKRNIFMKFLSNFGDPLIRILLVALGVNIVFLFRSADWFETVGIAATILIVTVVSTIAEAGSSAAFEKLQKETSEIVCRVRRGGVLSEVKSSELVVGDVVLLSSGDKVPADGVMLGGTLDIDQSALNGEAKEARKCVVAEAQSRHDDLLSKTLVFSGTVVLSGEGAFRVTNIGDDTYYGRIAAELQEETPPSPLKKQLERTAKKISLFGYIGASIVFLTYLFSVFFIENGMDPQRFMPMVTDYRVWLKELLHALTLAVSVIVMAVPEGLPMMITVVLSSNMRRMFKDKVLVRRLNGIETAGSMNIVFSDKTGTITTGKLTVSDLILPSGRNVVDGGECVALTRLLTGIYVNNGADMSGNRAIGGNGTDRALLSYAFKRCGAEQPNKMRVLPFSGERKFMATMSVLNGKNIVFFKGAPEKILAHCTRQLTDTGEVIPLMSTVRAKQQVDELNRRAVRVVAAAYSEASFDFNTGTLQKNLIYLGLVGVTDKVRPEAVKGIKSLRNAGIQTVMITGDSKLTAEAVAHSCGMIKSDSIILSGDELAAMSDDALKNILPRLAVVSRALPSDKSRLVRICQSMGLIVGMTGDGINDAPALKAANIGFAMGSGTEVAKEAGDIVILDDNFMSVVKAVSYGRTIYKSIRKFIIFQITVNFSAVFLSVVAPLFGIASPITVTQMLWINLVMDTFGGLAFSGERPRAEYLTEPPKKSGEPLINPYMWSQILTGSACVALTNLLFLVSPRMEFMFAFMKEGYHNTAFFTHFMFSAVVVGFAARTHRLNIFSNLKGNKQFIVIMTFIAVIQIVLVYVGGHVAGTVPLKIGHLCLVAALSAISLPVDFVRKMIVKRVGKFKPGT